MEHYSSYHNRLRKELTVTAVMDEKKIRMLQADIDKNDEKIDEIGRETNTIKKTIRNRRQKDREH